MTDQTLKLRSETRHPSAISKPGDSERHNHEPDAAQRNVRQGWLHEALRKAPCRKRQLEEPGLFWHRLSGTHPVSQRRHFSRQQPEKPDLQGWAKVRLAVPARTGCRSAGRAIDSLSAVS